MNTIPSNTINTSNSSNNTIDITPVILPRKEKYVCVYL